MVTEATKLKDPCSLEEKLIYGRTTASERSLGDRWGWENRQALCQRWNHLASLWKKQASSSVNSEYLLYTHTHTHTQKHTLLQLFMHTHGHTYTKRTCTYTQLYVDAHKFFHYRQQTKSHVFAQPHSWTKPYTT